MDNSVYTAPQHVPEPFKTFLNSEEHGKEIYNSIMFSPKTRDSDSDDAVKSIVTLHLAGDTKELIDLIDKKKTFLLKCGHMTLEDQTLILEVLFEHAFQSGKIYHKNIIKLLALMKEFLEPNYDKLNLVLDWKPCFNSLYAVLEDSELKMEMYALSSKTSNFYNLVESIFIKINKFFQQGSASEMFRAVKPYLFHGHPKFLSNLYCFSLLVPTKRFNTDEEEVEEWLPEIFQLWKSLPFSSYYRAMFMGMFARVAQYFNQIDYSPYKGWIDYQLNLEITKSEQAQGHGNSHSEKYFAQYFVNTFKSEEQLKIEGLDEDVNGFVKELVTKYYDLLHPSNKFKNKSSLIHLLKKMSSSLCARVRYERQKLSDDPDFKFKSLFLQQSDIKKFIEDLKPLLDIALESGNNLNHLSTALKNFITLDCDSILSMFLFQNFQDLEGLSNLNFIQILGDVVTGVLVNDQADSEFKYEFLQRTMKYLLEQCSSLEVRILKPTLQIFDSIWSTLPILPFSFTKSFIERVSKNKDYGKYMRAMQKKRVQEYQFYKLYEDLHSLATDYFELLKKIMNLGIPIKDELIRAFWAFFNSMQKEEYLPFVDDLLQNANSDHAGVVLGGALGNIASRDGEKADEVIKWVLGKLLDEENGQYELSFHNYAITEFYLCILSSVMYQNSDACMSNFDKIFTLGKLLYTEAKEDKERAKTVNFFKCALNSLSEFSVVFHGLLNEEKLSSDDYLKLLWRDHNQLSQFSFNFTIKSPTATHISFLTNFLHSTLLPWLASQLENCEKSQLKTLSGLLNVSCQTLFQIVASRGCPDSKNFTKFYFEGLLDAEIMQILEKLPSDVLKLAENFSGKILEEENLQKEVEVVKNVGEVYRHFVAGKALCAKGVTFNSVESSSGNKKSNLLFSMLQYKDYRRTELGFISEIGGIVKMLLGLEKAEYESYDESVDIAVNRTYQFEHMYASIPSAQTEPKAMASPLFIQYHDCTEEKHLNQMNKCHLEIQKAIKQVKESSEVEIVKMNNLISYLILLDKLANPEVVRKKDQVIKILLLVYTGGSIKDERVNKHIWNISLRAISNADRWKIYNPRFEIENADYFHVSSVFAKLNQLKTELETDIQKVQEEKEQLANDEKLISRSIVDSILNFAASLESQNLVQEDTKMMGTIDIWLCYFEQDEEYLLKILNYLTDRMFLMSSTVRNKALSIIRKITEARIKIHNFEYEEVKVEAMELDKPDSYRRYLPQEHEGYFDDLKYGYNSSVTVVKVPKSEVPFSKCDSETQSEDKLFSQLIDESKGFIKTLFSEILMELNSKADGKAIQEGSSKGDRIKNMLIKLMKQRSQGGDQNGDQNQNFTAILQSFKSMASGTRYFNVFYQMFKFYGLDIYKEEVLPVIQDYVKQGFKSIEHPHVCKAFLVDILCAAMRTCKYYFKDNEEVYNSTLALLYDLFDDSEQTDHLEYFAHSFKDAFSNRDPRRFESFITGIVENLSVASARAKHTLAFLKYFVEAFSWKGAQVYAKVIAKVLDEDFSTIAVAGKNIDKSISGVLRPILSKFWPILGQVMSGYVSLLILHGDFGENGSMEADGSYVKIVRYLSDVVEELESGMSYEEGDHLVNSCVLALTDVFCQISSSQNLYYLPQDLVKVGLKLSFIAIEKGLNKSTLTETTKMVESLLKKTYETKHNSPFNTYKDFILPYSKNPNWHIREHVQFIFQGLYSQLSRQNQISTLTPNSHLPFLEDENIYVVKIARLCLKTLLAASHQKPQTPKTPNVNFQIHLLLSILYAYGYKISPGIGKNILGLYQISLGVPELKPHVLEFISGFKAIHQQVVQYQPQRFGEEELQELKEVMQINSSQSMTY